MEVREVVVDSERLYVGVAGIRAERSLSPLLEILGELEEKYGAAVAIIKPAIALSARRLLIACEQAVRRYYEGRAIAKKLSIEILLNIAATRQIRDALEVAAAEPADDSAALALVAKGESELRALLDEILEVTGGSVDEEMLAPRETAVEELLEIYRVSEEELEVTYASSLLEALEKVLISRTAMLYVE